MDDTGIAAGRAVKWTLAAAGALVALSALGVLVGAVTLPGRSALGVAERTLDSGNVLRSYERFHDLRRAFEARASQARETQALLDGERDAAERGRLGIEARSQRQSCREIAAAYNADAAKLNRAIFRDAALPERLDESACEKKGG